MDSLTESEEEEEYVETPYAVTEAQLDTDEEKEDEKVEQHVTNKVDSKENVREVTAVKYLKKQELQEEASLAIQENEEELVISLTMQIIDLSFQFEQEMSSIKRKIEQAPLAPKTASCAIEWLEKKMATKTEGYQTVLSSLHILRKKYRDELLMDLTDTYEKFEVIDKISDKVTEKITMRDLKEKCTGNIDEQEDKLKKLKKIIAMDKAEIFLGKNIDDLEMYENFEVQTSELYGEGGSPSARYSELVVEEEIEVEVCEESQPSTVLLSSQDIHSNPEDVCYLLDNFGKPLTMALTEIMIRQPNDPIQYLAHWLMKYRYNPACKGIIDENEVNLLDMKRNAARRAKLLRILEDEARTAVYKAIDKAEEIGSENERLRLARELEMKENDKARHALLMELKRIHMEQVGLEQ